MPDIGIRVIVLGVAEARRNVGAVQSDITNLERTIRGVSGTAVSLGTSLTRVGSALVSVGRTMTIAVTAPIVAAGAALVNAGIQFEDTFAGIGKTVEGVMTPMGQLTQLGEQIRAEFRQMALEIPIATNELNSLGEMVGQLGVSADQVTEVTRTIAMLGATTELSAEEAAQGLIRFGNIVQFAGLTTEEFLSRAGSALVALGNTSVSTEGEILNLSLRLSAAGDRANFSAQEIMAWATTLSDLGVRAEMGGTAVSRAITEMLLAVQTGGEGIEEFAFVSGQGIEQFRRSFEEDASQALLHFITNLERGIRTGRVNEQMLRDMGLSGVRAIDVIGRLGDAQNIFERNLATSNREWERQLALQEEFNKRAATVQSQIQILKNRFTDLGITIFDLVRDDLVRLVEFIGDLIDKFKNLDPNVQKTILTIAGLAAVIGPLLIIVGGLVAALGTIITAFAALLTPVGLAAVALAGIGSVMLIAFGPQIVASIQSVIDKLKEFFGLGREHREDVPTVTIGGGRAEGDERRATRDVPAPPEPTGFELFTAKVKETLKQAETAILKFIATVTHAFGPQLQGVIDVATETMGKLGIDWSDIWSALGKSVKLVVLGIGGALTVLLALVLGIVGGILGGVQGALGFFDNFLGSIKKVTDGITNIVAGFVQIVTSLLRGDLGGAFKGLKLEMAGFLQTVAGVWSFLLTLIVSIVGIILGIITGFVAAMISTLAIMWEILTGGSAAGLQKIADKINEFRDNALAAMQEFVDGVIQGFQDMLDALIGESIVPEMVAGILAKFSELKDMAVNLINEMVGLIVGQIKKMESGTLAAIQSIIDASFGLTKGFQKFLNWLIANVGKILSFLDSIAAAAAAALGAASPAFSSPQFAIYYGFEDLFNLMSARSTDLLAPLGQISSLMQALSSATAPAGASNVSNVDQSVTVGDISATGLSDSEDLATVMLQRIQMARAVG